MKPASFAFHSVRDVKGALEVMGRSGAKPSAGNQSLGPMLNLRLARPSALVDVATLPQLRGVNERGHSVRYGAGITHAEFEDGDVPDATPGWLRAAAGRIAHRAVRNRGTVGGSLAHADPAADWVIVMTGLFAEVILTSRGGERRMPVAEFIKGPFQTALKADEIILAVEVPRPGLDGRWGYWKFVRQVGEFAKASAVVLADPATRRYRCALGALGGRPIVLAEPEAIIAGSVTPAAAVAQALPDRAAHERALHVAALTHALEAASTEPPAQA